MNAQRMHPLSFRRTLPRELFCAGLLILGVQLSGFAQDKPPTAAPQAPRAIPGVTAADPFPGGCVDCHVQLPHMDVRLSTLLKQWNQEVPQPLLAKAQAAAPEGLTLRGKHPAATKSLQNIPAGCLQCHKKDSKTAPPFARLLHAIHLTGGEQNHFILQFQGECTFCHKLDATTGAWSFASGSEKEPKQ